MTIKMPIDYVKETFLNGFSIAKPALDLLAERLDDARAFERSTSVVDPAEQRTSIPALIERHGRLETAVLCATVEHIAGAILVRNHGVRGAIARTLPVVGTRAHKTFDGACDFLIGRAHTLVVAAVKAFDDKLEEASSSSVVVEAGIHIADAGMRKVFGEHYVEDATEYVKALPVRVVDYSKVKAVEVYLPCKSGAERLRKESRLGSILFEAAVQSSFFGVMGISTFFAFTHVYAISVDGNEKEKEASPKPSPIFPASADALAITPYRDWRRSGVLFVLSPLFTTPNAETSFFSNISDSRRGGVDLGDDSDVVSLSSMTLPSGLDACNGQPEAGTEGAAVMQGMDCFDPSDDGQEDVCGVEDMNDIAFEKDGVDDEGGDRVAARYVGEDVPAALDVGEVVQPQDRRKDKSEADIGIECARFMATITAAIDSLEAECDGDDMAWVEGMQNVSVEAIDIDLAAMDVVRDGVYDSEGLTRRGESAGIRPLPCASSWRTARTVDIVSRTQSASRTPPTQVDRREPSFRHDAQSHFYPSSIPAFAISPTNDYSSATSNNTISAGTATNASVTATIIVTSTDDANTSTHHGIHDTDTFPTIDYDVCSSASVNKETYDNHSAIVNRTSSSPSAFKSFLLPSSILTTIEESDEDAWNAQQVAAYNVSEAVHFEGDSFSSVQKDLIEDEEHPIAVTVTKAANKDETEGAIVPQVVVSGTGRKGVFKMIDWATDVEESFSQLQLDQSQIEIDFVHTTLLGGVSNEDIGQIMVYETPSKPTRNPVEDDAESPRSHRASASIESYEEATEGMDHREALSFTVSMPCLVLEADSASVREALVFNTSVSFDCRLNSATGPWTAGEGAMESSAECHENGPAVEGKEEVVKPPNFFLTATAAPFVPSAHLASTDSQNAAPKPAYWEPARQTTPVVIQRPRARRSRTVASTGRRARHKAHMGTAAR